MLDAELEVCPDCGTLHMEGGPGPRNVEECANCGGHLSEVELDDLIGL
jgi:ribosomal protein L32